MGAPRRDPATLLQTPKARAARQRRAACKAKGICIQCHVAPADVDHVTCARCRVTLLARVNRIRREDEGSLEDARRVLKGSPHAD